MKENKRAPRYDVTIPVRFRDDEDYRVQFTQNISSGGLFLHTEFPPEPGTRLRLSLEPPGTRTAIPVTGEVAFSLPPDEAAEHGRAPGCGVRFVDMDPATLRLLESFVVSLERSSRGTVLLIDDDAEILAYMSELLRRHRFNVVGAPSAVKALKAIPYEPVDVILCDLHMPRMDGLELRDKLREDEDAAGIPFVIMTGAPAEEVEPTAEQLGVFSVLYKPVDIKALVDILAKALQHSGPRPVAKKDKNPSRSHRNNDIAFKKMASLGLPAQYTADEKRVVATIGLERLKLTNPVDGTIMAAGELENVGHARVAFTAPRLLANLPPIEMFELPDRAALEDAIVLAFRQRREWVEQGRRVLARHGIDSEFSASGFCAVGRLRIGPDLVSLTVRDEQTLVIEGVNGKPLTTVAPASACVVDLSEAGSANDVAMAIDTAIAPYRATGPSEPSTPVAPAQVEPEASEPRFPPAPEPAAAPLPDGWLSAEPDEGEVAEPAASVSALFGSMDDLLGVEQPDPTPLAVLSEDDFEPIE